MENKIKVYRLFYLSNVFIFGMAVLSHFMYKWSNYNTFIGFLTPTNESIFQHLKLVFFPTILYYFITYLLFAKKYDIDAKKYLISPLITIVVTSFVIVGSYYTFKYGLSISNMFVDISSFIIGLVLSSFICKMLYKRVRVFAFPATLSLICIFVLTLGLLFYDKNPMNVDLFYDHENNTYERVVN